jgi:hypothetical protein
MRSSRTSVSRFLLLTSLVLAVAGCDDEAPSCGPGDAEADGLVATSADVTIPYEGLEYGLNNDCPEDDAPANVVSLTIAGLQTAGAVGRFTICVGRPDLLASTPQALGIDEEGFEARVVDVTGTVDGCTYSFDDSVPPTGTVSSEGLCEAGANLEGFALTFDGEVTLERDCSGVIDSVVVALAGRVAALPQP